MHVGVYGSGYLGTVTSACLADFGIPVTCASGDAEVISALAQGNIPFHEKNLRDVLRRNVRAGRLIYSTELSSFCDRAHVIYLAEDSARYVEESAVTVAQACNKDQLLVICTPTPVGTARRIEARLRAMGSKMIVVAHPLFLTDGCAVEDFNWPDRILLGTSSSQAVSALKSLYRPLVMRGVPVIVTNFETAELAREASTAFMATKISFINELASLCEHVSADAVDLSLALGLDKKIAPRCLQPGAALGGPFVEAEMEALAQLAHSKGVPLKVLSAAREVNRSACDRIMDKIAGAMDVIGGKQIAVLGLAFKPNTNSVASSTSIQLAKTLLMKGAKVKAYDPVAIPEAQLELNGTVRYCDTPYAAVEGCDAVVLSTAWPEFRTLDFERIKRSVRQPLLVDTKNLLDGPRMRNIGFRYVGVGRA